MVEYTAGSTGSSLAYVCAAKGYRLRVVSTATITVFEPASTAVISGGEAGAHNVEGIGIGVVPPLLDTDRYDEVRPIDEAAGRHMARRLAATQGLFAGTSTGLNVVGALDLATELGTGRTVVTVACDTGLKYLTGDLYATEVVEPPKRVAR